MPDAAIFGIGLFTFLLLVGGLVFSFREIQRTTPGQAEKRK